MQAVKNSFDPNYLLGTLLVPDGIHGLSDLLRQCQNTASYGNNNYLKNIENRNISLDSGPHVRLPSGARRGAPALPCWLTAPAYPQHSHTALSLADPARTPHPHGLAGVVEVVQEHRDRHLEEEPAPRASALYTGRYSGQPEKSLLQ